MERIDLIVNKGCDFKCEFEVTDITTDEPVNCELYDFFMQVRKNNEFGDCVINATTKNGKLEVKGNHITFTLKPEDTEKLDSRPNYVYDIKGIDKSLGTVILFAKGFVILDEEITRMCELRND